MNVLWQHCLVMRGPDQSSRPIRLFLWIDRSEPQKIRPSFFFSRISFFSSSWSHSIEGLMTTYGLNQYGLHCCFIEWDPFPWWWLDGIGDDKKMKNESRSLRRIDFVYISKGWECFLNPDNLGNKWGACSCSSFSCSFS